MWWDLQLSVYCNFITESNSERILKIGYDLIKLLT